MDKRVVQRVDERIDEGVLKWFGHVERMEDRLAKRDYVGKCVNSHSVGKPHKRWIDTVKDCLRKRGLDVRQGRIMVQNRSEWWGFVKGECMGHSPGGKPNSYMKLVSGNLYAAGPTS